MMICRDEDCPECGWPETYYETDERTGVPIVIALGCHKCGWRQSKGWPGRD